MTPKAPPLDALADAPKALIARTLAGIETDPAAHAAVLDQAHGAVGGHVLGLTGPPGVGKSTLVQALIRRWRAQGDRVAVLAVDPTSQLSGGALLGDRTRIRTDPEDQDLFLRSLAARDRLGGVSTLTYPAMVLVRALFDRVLIETVGVGQSETDVAHVADTVLFCVQPASGDALQFMKAGIMEVPDLFAVGKADLGLPADRAVADLQGALALAPLPDPDWTPPVIKISAAKATGIEALTEAIAQHRAHLLRDGRLTRRRAAQAAFWWRDRIGFLFGARGLAAIPEDRFDPAHPFTSAQAVEADWTVTPAG
ncbi:MAG: ArgK/MeaB family GTPase [Rhodothalassiaceae bacterium]